MADAPEAWFQKRTDEELRDIRRLMSEVVPRREHELRWDVEAKNSERVQKQLDSITASVAELNTEVRVGHDELRTLIEENERTRLSGQLPKWFIPVAALVTSVGSGIVLHFLK